MSWVIERDTRRMRALRAYYNLKQSKLARAVGISRVYVSMIESGEVIPTPHVLERIRAALHWTPQVDALFDAVEEEVANDIDRTAEGNQKAGR